MDFANKIHVETNVEETQNEMVNRRGDKEIQERKKKKKGKRASSRSQRGNQGTREEGDGGIVRWIDSFQHFLPLAVTVHPSTTQELVVLSSCPNKYCVIAIVCSPGEYPRALTSTSITFRIACGDDVCAAGSVLS